MAIIVENGTQVAGANSYISLADARAILMDYGQELDINDETAETQLLKASKYIDAYRAAFKGNKNTGTQGMQWPRSNVIVDSWLIDNDTIPQALKNAQAFAAYESSQGEELQGSRTNQSIAEEEIVGAVKVKYFDTGAIDGAKILVRVMDELSPLLVSSLGIRGERG